MSRSLWFAADAEVASRSATDALVRYGFRVVRSFDLRSAVTGQGDCPCPHHGTEQCTCQFVVLLAYAAAGAPVVVTAHSQDMSAELRIVDDPNVPADATASSVVLVALAEAALALQASRADAEVGAC